MYLFFLTPLKRPRNSDQPRSSEYPSHQGYGLEKLFSTKTPGTLGEWLIRGLEQEMYKMDQNIPPTREQRSCPRLLGACAKDSGVNLRRPPQPKRANLRFNKDYNDNGRKHKCV